jgi:hypothetical protein
MTDYTAMSDMDLLLSVGSARPQRGGLLELFGPVSNKKLRAMQEEFDAARAEMVRRRDAGGFMFSLPAA